jgi:hypothetical protein
LQYDANAFLSFASFSRNLDFTSDEGLGGEDNLLSALNLATLVADELSFVDFGGYMRPLSERALETQVGSVVEGGVGSTSIIFSGF